MVHRTRGAQRLLKATLYGRVLNSVQTLMRRRLPILKLKNAKGTRIIACNEPLTRKPYSQIQGPYTAGSELGLLYALQHTQPTDPYLAELIASISSSS